MGAPSAARTSAAAALRTGSAKKGTRNTGFRTDSLSERIEATAAVGGTWSSAGRTKNPHVHQKPTIRAVRPVARRVRTKATAATSAGERHSVADVLIRDCPPGKTSGHLVKSNAHGNHATVDIGHNWRPRTVAQIHRPSDSPVKTGLAHFALLTLMIIELRAKQSSDHHSHGGGQHRSRLPNTGA